MLTKREIEKRRREMKRKARARKSLAEMVKNGIAFIILVVCMFVFIDKALDCWVQEIDNHAEYNRQYLQEIEEVKRAR